MKHFFTLLKQANILTALVIICAVALSTTSIQAQNACTGFRTQTQGGWGAECAGNNQSCYLIANFDAAFPDGLAIGCVTGNLLLTTSVATIEFLPSGTTP